MAIVASPDDPGGTGLLLEPKWNPMAKTYQEGIYKAVLPVIVFPADDIQQVYEK